MRRVDIRLGIDVPGLRWVLKRDRLYCRMNRLSHAPNTSQVQALIEAPPPRSAFNCICLLGLAGVAARQGEAARTARLWGAAEALRQVDGTPWPLDDQADIERTLATLADELDDTTFTTLWAEGQAMPLDEAVKYALHAPNPGTAHI